MPARGLPGAPGGEQTASGRKRTGLFMKSVWQWSYRGYDPKHQRLRETLCTLGNGYFAVRGSVPECTSLPVHYPGLYAAGCYNRLRSTVDGRTLENEDLVNLPNWSVLRYRCRPDGSPPGDWLSPDHRSLRHSGVRLDLRTGVLTMRWLFQDGLGRRLAVTHTRFVHMGTPHLAGQRTTLRALGWSGDIEIDAELDGSVVNAGVERYRALAKGHLVDLRTGVTPEDVQWLSCRTSRSRIAVGMAVRTVVAGADVRHSATATGVSTSSRVAVARGGRVTVTKILSLHTSRDRPPADPLPAALAELAATPGFDALLVTHRAAWDDLWREGEVAVPGEAGRILHLHLFHLLQSVSPHTTGLDVGVPARGLTGEAYRGHVFWDEAYVLPYLDLHFPSLARSLVLYRHRRLPRACEAARRAGHRGAMFPWQSGSDGREETQRLHLNPRSGRWLEDRSRLQRHVGSAVALDVWRYWQATGDDDFLHGPGAELMLRVAQFWSSLAEYDPGDALYHIRGVMGPDEYHDAYPGSQRPGLDDNAYTNVAAAWVLGRALDLVGALPPARRDELLGGMGLAGETDRWQDLTRRLHVPFHDGVISQFAGYEQLSELDWADYRARYGDIGRLDRILEAESDSVNRYKASKQADTLVLGYFFTPRELHEVFDRLGCPVDDDVWRRTVDYYRRRTSHGSTLSNLVHGWLLTRLRRADAWEYCSQALLSDVADIQGGTTAEGIHLGAMAGTLDLVQRGLTGLECTDTALRLDPVPLRQLQRLSFPVRYRGHRGIRLHVVRGRVGVEVPASQHGPLDLILPGDRRVTVEPGRQRWFHLPDSPDSTGR